MNICFSLLTNSENSLIFSVMLWHWENGICVCVFSQWSSSVPNLLLNVISLKVFEKVNIYISAQMFSDRKRGMSWIGLERLLCFSLEALGQRATLTGLSALNWLFYHMSSIIPNAYINKSLFHCRVICCLPLSQMWMETELLVHSCFVFKCHLCWETTDL